MMKKNVFYLSTLLIMSFTSYSIKAQEDKCPCNEINGYKVIKNDCEWVVTVIDPTKQVCSGSCHYETTQGKPLPAITPCPYAERQTPKEVLKGFLNSSDRQHIKEYKPVSGYSFLSEASPVSVIDGMAKFDVSFNDYKTHSIKYNVSNQLGENNGLLANSFNVPGGTGVVEIDFQGQVPGIYFINFQIDEQTYSRKVILH